MKDIFSKHKTLIIALIIILIMVLLFFLFKDDIKALFSKKKDSEETESKPEKQVATDTAPQTNSDPSNTYGNVETGKKVYANADGVKVLFKANAGTFRTKNRNEFIGVITGNTTLGGSDFYSIGSGLVVAKNKVYIK